MLLLLLLLPKCCVTPFSCACSLVWRHSETADARKLERLLPMLVALRGRVDSPDPKQCELSDRKCVIHEVRQHRILLQAVLQAAG
jgi:hypothetical protein